MRRLVLSGVLGLVAACGSSGSSSGTIDGFFPADNEVSGWTLSGAGGVEVCDGATAENCTLNLVDGDAQPFIDVGMKAFGRATYAKGATGLQLRIYEMTDATTCSALYDDIVVEDALYATYTWETIPLGEGGRIADRTDRWWINTISGPYFVEALVDEATAADPAARADGLAFVTAVVAGM